MNKHLYPLVCAALLLATGCTGEVDFPYAEPDMEEVQEDTGGQDTGDMQEGDPDLGDVGTPDMPDQDMGGPDMDGPEPDMGGEPDLPQVDPVLDRQVMIDTVMPALNTQTCTDGFCHGPNTTTNPFKLYPMPEGDEQINANLERFAAEVNFAAPGNSTLLSRATDQHQGVAINGDQYCQLFAWIDAADGNADQQCTPP